MSRFFSAQYDRLTPYVPGEQPQDRKYLKLNTNESPFPPSKNAVKLAAEAAENLQLYSDPACMKLRTALGETYGVTWDRVVVTNGSDEALYFAFSAWCDDTHPVMFPDITYGFYPVFADKLNLPYREVPLADDLTIDPAPYFNNEAMVVIANPNAPTGLLIPRQMIEELCEKNPDHIVVIDEAYVDFGNESAVPLTYRYPNLAVIGTFSKSRSLAGGRLGYMIADPALIADIETLRYSTNPYNVNSMTLAAGCGALLDAAYTRKNCETIVKNREALKAELKAMGFSVTDSRANFVFAAHPGLPGPMLYEKLKARGILVRRFSKPRIEDYSRITVGTAEQMAVLTDAIREILSEAL
ncbi:MAG: histidinol-phosphate transaminase [Lachnospiraceae bacterium]|nr:histidinol-phosphate transaminase [Lachnospiraceae bacterium]